MGVFKLFQKVAPAAQPSYLRKKSTWTEWSMTRSAGQMGLIFIGSAPNSSTTSRMAAKSTRAGTPVKSCRMTRAGLKETSTPLASRWFSFQLYTFSTSFFVTWNPSQLRITDSNRTLIEYGRQSKPTRRKQFQVLRQETFIRIN